MEISTARSRSSCPPSSARKNASSPARSPRPAAGRTSGATCSNRGRFRIEGLNEVIDPNKLTEKSQEALVAAQQKAREEGHAQLDVEHLAAALVDQPGGIVSSVLTALGVLPAQLSSALATVLQRQTKVTGSVQLSASARLGR